MVKAVVGANWGDEGKGKITDMLAEKADIIVRFQGGANAGHTIVDVYKRQTLGFPGKKGDAFEQKNLVLLWKMADLQSDLSEQSGRNACSDL